MQWSFCCNCVIVCMCNSISVWEKKIFNSARTCSAYKQWQCMQWMFCSVRVQSTFCSVRACNTHSVSECGCLSESVCNANKAYTARLSERCRLARLTESERRARDTSITWTLLLLSCFGFIVWSMKHRLVGEELFCLTWRVKNSNVKKNKHHWLLTWY